MIAMLNRRQIDDDFYYSIASLLERLRSALDYCANRVHAKFVRIPTKGKVHFPIADARANSATFAKQVNDQMRGFTKARPDLLTRLESFQAFATPSNEWLPKLRDFSNRGKHIDLVQKALKETRVLTIGNEHETTYRVEGGGTTFIINSDVAGGGKVHLHASGPGMETYTDATEDVKVVQGTEISIHFAATGDEVYPFLKRSHDGVSAIVEEMATW